MSELLVTGERTCDRCGKPRGPRRTRYCGDICLGEALAEREQERSRQRLTACQRCGGDKELGTRGGKYCGECRRVIADSSEQREAERGRRRWLTKVADKAASGQRISVRTKDAPEGTKWCARCQDFRALTSFGARKNQKKLPSYCLPCQRAYNQERRLTLIFGLTWDDYEAILAQQDGRCAICRGKPRKFALSVDHDHKTGEIRGLLCSRCNHRLLGSANDDAERLRRAAEYLEEFAPRQVFGGVRRAPGFGPKAADPD